MISMVALAALLGGTPAAEPATHATAKRVEAADEELVANLELLENMELLQRLGLLDDLELFGMEDGDGGKK